MRRLKNRQRAKRARMLCFITSLLLIVTLILNNAFNKTEPIILVLCENQFKNIITSTVYSLTEEINMDNIVKPVYSNENRIVSLTTDTSTLNNITKMIVDGLEDRIGGKDINIEIPIGDVIGDSLSLGQGPSFVLQINQYKSTHAEIISNFTESGINQTIHSLSLYLEVESVVLLPGLNTEKIKACLSLPLSETLIVGDTPLSYFNPYSLK